MRKMLLLFDSEKMKYIDYYMYFIFNTKMGGANNLKTATTKSTIICSDITH